MSVRKMTQEIEDKLTAITDLRLDTITGLLADIRREHDRVVEDLCDGITSGQYRYEDLLTQVKLYHPNSPILYAIDLEEEKKIWARTPPSS